MHELALLAVGQWRQQALRAGRGDGERALAPVGRDDLALEQPLFFQPRTHRGPGRGVDRGQAGQRHLADTRMVDQAAQDRVLHRRQLAARGRLPHPSGSSTAMRSLQLIWGRHPVDGADSVKEGDQFLSQHCRHSIIAVNAVARAAHEPGRRKRDACGLLRVASLAARVGSWNLVVGGVLYMRRFECACCGGCHLRG